MSFSVVQIGLASVLYREDMGTKDKSWCRIEGDDRLWLFKKPRTISALGGLAGEHWAEKIASEVGVLMGVPIARVELAELDGHPGTITRQIKADERESIVHGNEVLAGFLKEYDKGLKRSQTLHTWANIRDAIRSRCGGHCGEILHTLCGYLVLDAWIGNTDRHHENWALLARSDADGSVSYRMCPSFDHASSLGRELTDLKRERWLDRGIARYLDNPKSCGAIFWATSDARPMPLLGLVRRIRETLPDAVAFWIQALRSISEEQWVTVIDEVPSAWMSVPARRFATEMLRRNQQDLTS